MTTTTLSHDLRAGLGVLVSWDLSNTSILPHDLRSILTVEGEDPAIVPDIDPAAAVKRATREWSQGRGAADRYRAEVVREDAGTVEVGILRRQRVDDHEVKWVQVDHVVFETTAGALVRGHGIGSDQAAAFSALADKRATYLDADWIRPGLVQARLAGWGAFRLSRHGGVEYVPVQHRENVERLARIVERIGDSRFDLVDVAATEASRKTIGSGARDNLAEALGEVTSKLDEWEKSTRSIPSHSVAAVLERFADVSMRAELYAGALEVSVDDLREKLDAAKVRARALLAGATVGDDERQAG